MKKQSFKEGDYVFIKRSDGSRGESLYRITQMAGFQCAMAEVKPDMTLYKAQPWDTSLLKKASPEQVANAFNRAVLGTFFGSI